MALISGRRKLDRQRQTVETLAQLLDGQLGRLVGQEIGPALSGALKEQAPGIVGSEWIQPPHGLAVHRERLATRGQDADLRARVQQRRGQLRTFVDHVLAVVEDDQEVALGQVLTERVERFGSTAAPKAEHASGLSCDLGRLCSRREVDEPYAVEPTSELPPSYFDRQPRLANAARSGQRHQPPPAKYLTDTVEVSRPADERGECGGDRPTRERTRTHVFSGRGAVTA
jgi:hypothetical protein